MITPQLVAAVPDGSPLLSTLGKNFHSVGMSTEAMGAFIKGGDAKAAIDSCVQHHKWESALHLAEIHKTPGIQKVAIMNHNEP